MTSTYGAGLNTQSLRSTAALRIAIRLSAACFVLLFAAIAGRAVTLSQNTDQTTIIDTNSISCNLAGSHSNNSYWRAFRPSDFGQTGFFAVTGVRIGVEEATATAGNQPITVRVYSGSGAPFPLGALTLLGTLNTTVANGNLVFNDFTVTTGPIPVTTQIIVEIFTPNGQAVNSRFFIGSNNLGQSAPSYITAADCGAPIPINVATAGGSNMHTLIALVGNVTPTAAASTVSGRVLTADGRGIRNARVSVTSQTGEVRTALTGSFGYYSIEDLPAGQSYLLSIGSKRYVFANPTRLITLNDDLNGEDFVADGEHP